MADQIKPAIVPNFDTMPPELKALNRWVCWVFDDEARKVPKAPWLGRGRNASSTNPATWGTFEQARAAYEGGGFSGVGFVLNNDGLVGVDLDHCSTDGAHQPGALALLGSMRATYVEVSPSGAGLRALGYGAAIETGVKGTVDGVSTELYSTGRYLTLTGQIVKAGPLGDLHGFGDLAKTIKQGNKPSNDTAEDLSTADKQTRWIDALMSGETYHDSLRDLAASYVGQGMPAASVEALLYGLMDNATQRSEWAARRAQIPELVASAVAKFGTAGFDDAVAQAKPNAGRFALLSSDDLREIPPISWIVKGVIPADGVSAIYGDPGSGKSFLTLDLAAHISEGAHWFGIRTKHRAVIYVALEGESGVKLRVQAWEHHHGRQLPPAVGVMLQPFGLTTAQDIADLAAVIPDGACVFIDTLNASAPGIDENTSAGMGSVIEGAKTLRRKINGSVVLIHHTGKNSEKGPRGHSSLLGALDAGIVVSRDGDVREWYIPKVKDGKDGLHFGFSLEVQMLGLDDDGDPITSCVVVPTFQPVVTRKPLTPALQLALTAFHAADAGVGVTRDDWRAELYRRMPDAEPVAKRQALSRAVAALVQSGYLERDGDYFFEPLF